MELLVFKVNDKYLRFRDDSFEYSDMNKASVFQLSDKEKVMEKLNTLKLELENVSVKKLSITESEYL
jgi:hypothetical protein